MSTFVVENVNNDPVWVNTANCKACDICVSVCPAGVLSMVYEESSTLGAMISVDHPEACIGCNDCELNCPDFAIFVAEKADLKAVGKSFAKLTDDAKERQAAIVANNYMSVSQGA
ncbi:MAG: 4Fe-4S dicluster domain-containing protein [Epsilonproteobacteria bacterium]|nr:4Fe-4S dicluster domain-containing protein [Campylobacterota bacterium]